MKKIIWVTVASLAVGIVAGMISVRYHLWGVKKISPIFGAGIDTTVLTSFIGSSSSPVWLGGDFSDASPDNNVPSTTLDVEGFSGVDLYLALLPSSTTSTVQFTVLGSPDRTNYYNLGTTTVPFAVTPASGSGSTMIVYGLPSTTPILWKPAMNTTEEVFGFIPLSIEGQKSLKFNFAYFCNRGAGGTDCNYHGGKLWVQATLKEKNP